MYPHGSLYAGGLWHGEAPWMLRGLQADLEVNFLFVAAKDGKYWLRIDVDSTVLASCLFCQCTSQMYLWFLRFS